MQHDKEKEPSSNSCDSFLRHFGEGKAMGTENRFWFFARDWPQRGVIGSFWIRMLCLDCGMTSCVFRIYRMLHLKKGECKLYLNKPGLKPGHQKTRQSTHIHTQNNQKGIRTQVSISRWTYKTQYTHTIVYDIAGPMDELEYVQHGYILVKIGKSKSHRTACSTMPFL